MPWVAESWNTVSNGAYIVLGLVPLPQSFSQSPARPLFLVLLVTTGVLSILFHATLWFWAQKLDEMAENAMLLSLLYLPRPNAVRRIALHASFCCVGIATIPTLFAELHLVAVVLLLLRMQWRYVQRGSSSHAHAEALEVSAGRAAAFGLAGFGAWVADHVACTALPDLSQRVQLHAWWHLLTALALHHAGHAAEAAHRIEHVPPP